MTNIDDKEAFREHFSKKWEARKNNPTETKAFIKFDELPWEDPMDYKGVPENGEVHLAKLGQFGILVLNWMDPQTSGSRVYIFTENDQSYADMLNKVSKVQEENTQFHSTMFAIGMGQIDTDPMFNSPWEFKDGKRYVLPHGILIGGEASNSQVRSVLPKFETMGLIPKGLDNWLPGDV